MWLERNNDSSPQIEIGKCQTPKDSQNPMFHSLKENAS